MALERLVLYGFQKHHKLTIPLDSNIVCLTGASDQGKSSVIRALKWLAMNQPGGDSFIREGETIAEARLFADGKCVRRSRGKGTNKYTLDGKEFTAFGTTVPDEISSLLNLSDINFQLQHEQSFWLSLSPGECARRLNEIVNLEAIDKATSEAASRVRQVKSQLENSKLRLEDAEKEAASLGWVERAYAGWQKVERLEQNAQDARRDLSRLRKLTEEVEGASAARRDVSEAVSKAQGWLKLGEEWLAARESLRRAKELLATIQANERAAEQTKKKAQDAADRLAAATDLCPVCGKKWKK